MGNTTITELFGLLGAIVIVGGLSVAIVNGGKTAQVVGSFGKAFSDSLRVATRGGK